MRRRGREPAQLGGGGAGVSGLVEAPLGLA
jgi:hypothetical protein